MFFSKNNKEHDRGKSTIAECVAQYFGVTPNSLGDIIDIKNKSLSIQLPFSAQREFSSLERQLSLSFPTFSDIKLSINIPIAKAKGNLVPNVKNIIAVASGKGGVGKSATAVNLAFALQQQGARVGIIDADIYGPSIPIMLGNAGHYPASRDNKIMQPLLAHGMPVNSIGYLVPEENATVWRGPMASRALTQLMYETQWPLLDYLIVDLPPGTGDIQLTLAQQMPLTGAVIVTTPQDLALADARKAVAMFNKLAIPILGLVENMSYFQCNHCSTKSAIFSAHGGAKMAEKHNISLLAEIPLDMSIREHADKGTPLLLTQANAAISSAYLKAALALSVKIGTQLAHYDVKKNSNRGLGIPIANKE